MEDDINVSFILGKAGAGSPSSPELGTAQSQLVCIMFCIYTCYIWQ